MASPAAAARSWRATIPAAVVAGGVAALLAAPEEIGWRSYAGDGASTRYSAAADITPHNVTALAPAWTWQPREGSGDSGPVPGRFESTPLMIGGTVYVTTPLGVLVALDATTGAERWRFDAGGAAQGPTSVGVGFVHRGVAAWSEAGRLRLFLGSRHRIVSVDGDTGKPDDSFADHGILDLRKGAVRAFDSRHVELTSPPLVYGHLLIVGSAIGDRLMSANDPPGEVRAFDVRTGAPVWSFHLIPRPGEFGVDTWERESWAINGHTNVWTTMSVDEARGLLYVPVSTPTNDYYGGRRPGANLFAESLVCLDASTGERQWHFQTVHHGLWDYDLPAAPTLATITQNGAPVDIVAQVTKTGFTFVFERVTGRPIWPIEERPVPPSDVPGEQASATQPFPTRPPPFAAQGIGLEDAFDLSPALKTEAQAAMRRMRLGRLFTPPSLEGTLMRPGNVGGANWGGAAWDPVAHRLFVHASGGISSAKLARFDRATSTNADAMFVDADWVLASYTQEAAGATTFHGGLPLNKPPYATVTAIDLDTGRIDWQVPFGEGPPAIREHPALAGIDLPARLGTPSNAGVIVTQPGVVFGGGGDPYLYALDAKSGRELWRGSLPQPAGATPMTYRTAAGRQFVVIATGGGSSSTLVAFALTPRAN